MKGSPEIDDERLAALLRSIERDGMQRSEHRHLVRSEVLATFDSGVAEGGSARDITLSSSEARRRASVARWRLPAAAAATVALVGAALLVVARPDPIVPGGRPANGGDDASTTTFVVDDGSLRPLPPVDATTFEVPDGFEVALDNGVAVVLETRPDDVGGIDSIVLVTVTNGGVVDRIDALAADGDLRALQSAVDIGGQRQQRREVSITQQGARDRSCAAGTPCLELVEGESASAIPPDAQVQLIEVEFDAQLAVVVISDAGGAVGAAALDVARSLRLADQQDG